MGNVNTPESSISLRTSHEDIIRKLVAQNSFMRQRKIFALESTFTDTSGGKHLSR